MLKKIRSFLLLILPLTAFILSAAAIGVAMPNKVTIYIDGEKVETVSFEKNVNNILQSIGIFVSPVDDIFPTVASRLGIDNTIIIQRKSNTLYTEPDLVKPMMAASRVFYDDKVVDVPYKSVRKENAWMARGRTRLISRGKTGKSSVRYKITAIAGKEVKREIVREKTLKEAKPEIVAYGTGKAVFASRAKDHSQAKFSGTSAGSLIMTATGYYKYVTGTGITATGRKATKGVVAVDPRVIPLGTKLFVEGYGYAIAADKGSAIKGNRIDLCFDTYQEAKRYGRRKVTVQIIK